ncbi:hypothetical protein Tco_1058176, partial [Tanacetum coccineum]
MGLEIIGNKYSVKIEYVSVDPVTWFKEEVNGRLQLNIKNCLELYNGTTDMLEMIIDTWIELGYVPSLAESKDTTEFKCHGSGSTSSRSGRSGSDGYARCGGSSQYNSSGYKRRCLCSDIIVVRLLKNGKGFTKGRIIKSIPFFLQLSLLLEKEQKISNTPEFLRLEP